MGVSSSNRLRAIAIVVGALVLAGVCAAVLISSGSGANAGAGPATTDDAGFAAADPAHQPPAAERTVFVAGPDSDRVSDPSEPLETALMRGEMPSGQTSAEVLTDTDCAPDKRGVSNCHNRLRLADGSTIQVIHSHRMADVPCLSPGETVSVEPA